MSQEEKIKRGAQRKGRGTDTDGGREVGVVEEESEVFSVRSTKEKRKEGNLKNRNPSTAS